MRLFHVPVVAANLLAAFVFSTAAAVDVVELRGGGQIEGTVKRVEQERAPYVVVQVDAKIRVAIPESQVARVAESADLEEYRQRSKDVKEVADELYELARWCKGKQLIAQYRYHLQRAIAIDPEHSKARAALGYVTYEGHWIRNSQLRKIRGMIWVSGQDRLPEEVALSDAQEETTIAVKKWNLEIARLRTAVLRGGDRGAESQAKLAAIEDPNAAPAMAHDGAVRLHGAYTVKCPAWSLRYTAARLQGRARRVRSLRPRPRFCLCLVAATPSSKAYQLPSNGVDTRLPDRC